MRRNGLKSQASVGGYERKSAFKKKSMVPLRYQSVAVKHAVTYIVIT